MDLTLRFPAHPSEEVIEAYALKRLPQDQLAQIETHLLACETCQDILADLDVFISSMKAVAPEVAPVRILPQRGVRFPRWQTALAAAAVVVTAVYLQWDSGARPVPVTVPLSSERGIETATAPAGPPLVLGLSSTQIDGRAGFRIEIVTADGSPAWKGAVASSAEGNPQVRLEEGLSRGTYWVRLYGPDDRLLQEYGLRLQ